MVGHENGPSKYDDQPRSTREFLGTHTVKKHRYCLRMGMTGEHRPNKVPIHQRMSGSDLPHEKHVPIWGTKFEEIQDEMMFFFLGDGGMGGGEID